MKSYSLKISLFSLCALVSPCCISAAAPSEDDIRKLKKAALEAQKQAAEAKQAEIEQRKKDNKVWTPQELQDEQKEILSLLETANKNIDEYEIRLIGSTTSTESILDIKKNVDCYAVLRLLFKGDVKTSSLREKLGKEHKDYNRLKEIEENVAALNLGNPYVLEYVAKTIKEKINKYRDSKKDTPEEDITKLSYSKKIALWVVPKFLWSLAGKEYIDMDMQRAMWADAMDKQVEELLEYCDKVKVYQGLRYNAMRTLAQESRLLPRGGSTEYAALATNLFNKRYPHLSDEKAPKFDPKVFDYKYPTETTVGQLFVVAFDGIVIFLLIKGIMLLFKGDRAQSDADGEEEDDDVVMEDDEL